MENGRTIVNRQTLIPLGIVASLFFFLCTTFIGGGAIIWKIASDRQEQVGKIDSNIAWRIQADGRFQKIEDNTDILRLDMRDIKTAFGVKDSQARKELTP